MSPAHFCVSWDSYKNYISNGFSRFQQNSEFVDMTLAAEGHLVKVHQNIVALASPYLKAMIQSASCPHPVVFLNNISHDTLAYILEYIYTGEVKVSKEEIATFIDACKSLGVSGVENFAVPKNNVTVVISEEPRPPQESQAESQLEVVLKPQVNSLLKPLSEPLLKSQHDILQDSPVHKLPDPPVKVLPDPSVEVLPDSPVAALPDPPVEILSDALKVVLLDSQLEELLDSQLKEVPELQLDILPGSKQETLPKPQLDIPEEPHLTVVPEQLPDLPLIEIERAKPPENNFAAHITINSDNNYNLEVKQIEQNITQNKTCPITTVDNFVVKYDNAFCEVDDNATANLQAQPLHMISIDSNDLNFDPSETLVNNETEIQNNLSAVDISNVDQIKQNVFFNLGLGTEKSVTQPVRKKKLLSKEERDKMVHYTISNRGSLQLMLNRYIYCCHHHSCGGRKRRWRCADYRKLHCPAIIDTDNDEIINRSDQHNHTSHDSKILKKFKSKLIFTSIVPAEEKCNSLKESETENEYSKPKTKRRKFNA